MSECKHCNDEPYEVGYVDVGIGSVPAYIHWECEYCFEVLETKRWSRRYANLMIIKHKIIKLYIRVLSVKYKLRPIQEEEEIPF